MNALQSKCVDCVGAHYWSPCTPLLWELLQSLRASVVLQGLHEAPLLCLCEFSPDATVIPSPCQTAFPVEWYWQVRTSSTHRLRWIKLDCTALHPPPISSIMLYSTTSQGSYCLAAHLNSHTCISWMFCTSELPSLPYPILSYVLKFLFDWCCSSSYYLPPSCIRSKGWAHFVDNQKTSNHQFRLSEFSSESVARSILYGAGPGSGSGSIPKIRNPWHRVDEE